MIERAGVLGQSRFATPAPEKSHVSAECIGVPVHNHIFNIRRFRIEIHLHRVRMRETVSRNHLNILAGRVGNRQIKLLLGHRFVLFLAISKSDRPEMERCKEVKNRSVNWSLFLEFQSIAD